jgi:hypothetical protein
LSTNSCTSMKIISFVFCSGLKWKRANSKNSV